MGKDTIYRQDAIDELGFGAELLRRVLDDTDVVGTERAKFEWGLGLIESCISDVKDLPSAQPEIIRCKDCKYRHLKNMIWTCPFGLPSGENFFCGYGAEPYNGEQDE